VFYIDLAIYLINKTEFSWKTPNSLGDPKLLKGSVYIRAEFDLLKAQKHKLQPQPGQDEHQHHVGERETEPTRKVDHAAVIREEAVDDEEEKTWRSTKRSRLKHLDQPGRLIKK